MNVKPSTVFTGDNLHILRGMDDACVDLIYLDPPFNSKKAHAAPLGSEAAGAAFKDSWHLSDLDEAWHGELAEAEPAIYAAIAGSEYTYNKGMKAYLIMMAIRLIEMRRILKPTGGIYLHCDPTAGHYLKILLDAIFGWRNFRNQIIWSYKSGGASERTFAKKHDTIFYYSVSGKRTFNVQKEKSYNRDLRPYGFAGVKEYEDKFGWYTMVNMRDVWRLDMVGRTSKERIGYPTQKPIALLERIITVSSNEGDVVLDPFCGCATACIAAERLGRKWIGIDISPKAIDLVQGRLENEIGHLYKKPIHRTDIPLRKGGKRSKDIKHALFGRQEGRCAGCRDEFQFRNFEVDHIVPKAKGGADDDRNLQLLCGWCNRKKGGESMAHLIAKLKREGVLPHPRRARRPRRR